MVVGPDDPAASVVFPASITYAYEPNTQLSYQVELNATDRTRDASDGVPENSDIKLGMSLTAGPATAETTAQMSYKRVADGLISGFVQQSVTRMSGTLTTEVDFSGHYDSAPDLIVRSSNEFDYEIRSTLVNDDRG